MAILVDYRCAACGNNEERRLPSPPPTVVSCSRCGSEARRAWVPIGLSGSRREQPVDATARGTGHSPGPSLASRYPHLPGLCHMSESAGRMWVAKYQGDTQAVERELAHQEHSAQSRPPTMGDVIAHPHTTDGRTPSGTPGQD